MFVQFIVFNLSSNYLIHKGENIYICSYLYFPKEGNVMIIWVIVAVFVVILVLLFMKLIKFGLILGLIALILVGGYMVLDEYVFNAVPECSDYCLAQPHAACDGNWDVSGEYPDCVCSFICNISNSIEGDE